MGTLLGPFVLERFAPNIYDAVFPADEAVNAQLETLNKQIDDPAAATLSPEEIAEHIQALDELEAEHEKAVALARRTDVTESYIDTLIEDYENRRQAMIDAHQQLQVSRVNRLMVERANLLDVQRQSRARLQADRLNAILLTMIAVFFIESLFGDRHHPVARRFTIVRYALVSLWLAMILACPQPLRTLNLTFLVGLIAVALIVGFVPLPRKRGNLVGPGPPGHDCQ